MTRSIHHLFVSRHGILAVAFGLALAAAPAQAFGERLVPRPPCGALRPDACFGYYPTQWQPWAVACGQANCLTPLSAGVALPPLTTLPPVPAPKAETPKDEMPKDETPKSDKPKGKSDTPPESLPRPKAVPPAGSSVLSDLLPISIPTAEPAAARRGLLSPRSP